MNIEAFIFEKALGYFVTALCGAMVGAIVHLWRKVSELHKIEMDTEKKRQEEQEAMKDGIRAMMRDRIYQSCKYHMSKGFITTTDLEVLESLNESYKKLHGNGIAEKLMHQVHELTIKVDEVH